MTRFIEYQLDLTYPDENGVSKVDHLKQVEKTLEDFPKELIQPEIDPELFGLVETFWNCRKDGAVSYQELEAYCRMTGERLNNVELRFIRDMDSTATAWINKRNKPKIKNEPPRPKTGRVGRR